MVINTENTKAMMINEQIAEENQNNKIYYKGENLDEVATFDNLGVGNDGKMDIEILNRTKR